MDYLIFYFYFFRGVNGADVFYPCIKKKLWTGIK